MSFPPPRDAGSSSAPVNRGFVLGPDEGDPYHWLGTLTLTKVMGTSTGGQLDIVDHRVPPGYAPPRHIHTQADEIFFLLAGQLDINCGDDSWQAGPGSLIFLPRGIPHQFTAASDGPARTLLINAPAGFGDVIVALGDAAPGLNMPAPGGPMPEPDRIAQVQAQYGIEVADGS